MLYYTQIIDVYGNTAAIKNGVQRTPSFAGVRGVPVHLPLPPPQAAQKNLRNYKTKMYSTIITDNKILSQDNLAIEIQRRQATGEHGVFTNGCFDLLHLGHICYLQEAHALGDFLILALNNDDGVRLLKGPGRPLVPENERAKILAAFTCIDYVTIFNEPTAGPLVALLQPSIYVKGGDYAGSDNTLPDLNRLPEAKVVQEYGGIVRLIPYLPHHSTTELIAAIKRLP